MGVSGGELIHPVAVVPDRARKILAVKYFQRQAAIHPLINGITRRAAQGGKQSVEFTGVLKVVAGAGIEPATQGFSVLCSTN